MVTTTADPGAGSATGGGSWSRGFWHSPSYLDHAGDGVADRRTYRRGNFVVGLIWGLSSLALVKIVIWGSVEIAKSSDPAGLLAAVRDSSHAPFAWLTFLAALIGFVPLAVILPWYIQRTHKRPWRLSATPFSTFSWRQIGAGAGLGAAMYIGVSVFTGLAVRGQVDFDARLGDLVPAVLVLLVLIPVQAFGQELFFRGYGLQQASLDIVRPRALATISGLAFGIPILVSPFFVRWIVPEVQVPDVPWTERLLLVGAYVALGGALAMISMKTGTIELAIGVAASVNLLSALVLSPRAGSMAGGSVAEVEPGLVPTAVYAGALVAGLYVLVKVSQRFVPDPQTRTLIDHFGDPVRGVRAPLPTGNPMWRVTVRGLLAHRLRLVLTLSSIALGVSFIVATMVFADTTKAALDRFYSAAPADVVVKPMDQVTIEGQGGPAPDLTMPAAIAERVKKVPGVAVAASQVQEEGVLILDAAGDAIGSATSSHVGASWQTEQIEVGGSGSGGGFDGQLPEGDNQVAIDTATADRSGLGIGDEVRLITPLDTDKAKPWKITGIIDIGLYGGATVALFDLPTAQRYITGPGTVNQVLVKVAEGATVADVVERINAELGSDSGVRAISGAQEAQQEQVRVSQGLGFLNTVLMIFGFIAVFMSAFLIFNTFSMLVAQRTRELALVRAVGAGSDQVQTSVLVQAALVGAVGTLVGMAVGVAMSVLIRWLLAVFNIDIPAGGLVIAPRTLLIAGLAGLGVSLLAAWLPAVRASRVPPVRAMQAAAGPGHSDSRRWIIGGILAGLALTCAVLALRDSTPETAVAWMGLSALLGIGAFIVGSALLAAPAVRLVGLPFRSATGRLASANARRNRRRTAATAAALTIGVGLMTMVSILATSTVATADSEIEKAVGADLTIGAPPLYRPFHHGLTEELAALPGVASSTYIRATSGQRGEAAVEVFGVEPRKIRNAVNLNVTAGDLADVGGDKIAVDSNLAEKYRLKVGEEFWATFRTGIHKFEVAAIFDPIIVYKGILTDFAAAASLGARTDQDTSTYLNLAPGADREAVVRSVERVLERNPALKVSDKETLKADFADQIDRLLGFVYIMLALTVLIAVLGIVNTLLLSVYERTAELGMLRAVGATRADVRHMITIEALLVGVFGAVCGVAIGGVYGWLLQIVMAPLGILRLDIPWLLLGVFVIAGALAGVLASLWPAIRAARLNIIESVAAE